MESFVYIITIIKGGGALAVILHPSFSGNILAALHMSEKSDKSFYTNNKESVS